MIKSSASGPRESLFSPSSSSLLVIISIVHKILVSILQSNRMFVCLFVTFLLWDGRTDLLYFFFESTVLVRGFFLANIRIRDPETPGFKAFFDNLAEIFRKYYLLPKYNCRKKIRILDFPDPSSGFSGYLEKSVLTVYLHLIHHFSSFQHRKFFFENKNQILHIFLNL